MNSMTSNAKTTDVTAIDVERGLQRARRLRAEAFASVAKTIFSFGGLLERRRPDDRRQTTTRDDCAAAV